MKVPWFLWWVKKISISIPIFVTRLFGVMLCVMTNDELTVDLFWYVGSAYSMHKFNHPGPTSFAMGTAFDHCHSGLFFTDTHLHVSNPRFPKSWFELLQIITVGEFCYLFFAVENGSALLYPRYCCGWSRRCYRSEGEESPNINTKLSSILDPISRRWRV